MAKKPDLPASFDDLPSIGARRQQPQQPSQEGPFFGMHPPPEWLEDSVQQIRTEYGDYYSVAPLAGDGTGIGTLQAFREIDGAVYSYRLLALYGAQVRVAIVAAPAWWPKVLSKDYTLADAENGK